MTSQLSGALRWAVSANAVVNLINIAGLLVFARLLGVATIGAYGALLVTIELIAMVFSFGFNQAVIRFGVDNEIFSAAFTLVFIQCLLIVIAVLSIGTLAKALEVSILTPGGPLFALLGTRIATIFATLTYAPLERQMQYRQIAISKAIAATTAFGVGLIATFMLRNSDLVLPLRDLTNAMLMFLILAPQSKATFRFSTNRQALMKVWKFNRPIWLLNLLERAALRADYFIVSWLVEAGTFGIYYQVRALVEGALGFVVNPIQTVVYSYYCKQENILIRFRTFVRQWFYPFLAGTFAVSCLFLLTQSGQRVVAIIYGPEWEMGGAMLAGFSLYAAAMVAFEHTKVVAIAANTKKSAIIGRLLQIALIISLVPLLTQLEGLSGAGIASGIAAASMCFIASLRLYKDRGPATNG